MSESLSDSTVRFQSELTAGFREQYPLVTSADALVPYQMRETPYISFAYRRDGKGFRNDLLKPIITTSLIAAATPNDAAFCLHGSNHDTFQGVIKRVLHEVNGTGKVRIEESNRMHRFPKYIV